MSAYWIAHVTVHDPVAYGEYARRATVAIADHGGEFLARASRYQQLEGTERPRHVLAVFPTFEAAIACYESDAYQHALGFAKGASERDLVVVEGV